MVLVLLLNVPLAPLAGAVNVTLTPDTAFPKASVTRTTSGPANAVFTVAVCGEPDVTVIAVAAPGVMLNAAEVSPVRVPSEKTSVYPVPTLLMLRFGKVATPPTAATVRVPLRIPADGFVPI